MINGGVLYGSISNPSSVDGIVESSNRIFWVMFEPIIYLNARYNSVDCNINCYLEKCSGCPFDSWEVN